jgi:uncharacterized damage-inducible protein DinB
MSSASVAREVERVRDLHRRAFEGNAWHGPAVLELLAGVTWEDAVSRPVAGAHTILELVLHIAAWEETVARRLVSSEPIELSPAQDWERPTFSAQAWEDAKQRLDAARAKLDAALGRLSGSRLIERVPGRDYDAGTMLHGVVQHTLYHAGQIALVKKAIGGS